MSHDRILILDFGSQVTQLIARRVREAHVYCEVHPNDVSAEFIREYNPKGIILSGSHMSAYEESNDQASQAVFEAGVPVLGICYGMQIENMSPAELVEGLTLKVYERLPFLVETVVAELDRQGYPLTRKED